MSAWSVAFLEHTTYKQRPWREMWPTITNLFKSWGDYTIHRDGSIMIGIIYEILLNENQIHSPQLQVRDNTNLSYIFLDYGVILQLIRDWIASVSLANRRACFTLSPPLDKYPWTQHFCHTQMREKPNHESVFPSARRLGWSGTIGRGKGGFHCRW